MTTPANKPINVILLGDPGAGKATQAEHLVKKYKLYDFDMGRELSQKRKSDKQFNDLLKKTTDIGKLAPTSAVRQLIKDTIEKVPLKNGILFDGHPKMLGEAKLVSKLLKQLGRQKPLVIYLHIPIEETVKRVTQRSGYFDGKFGKRADDTHLALKNRVKYYRTNIVQVVDYFKSQYDFVRISGLGTRSEVKNRFEQTVKNYISKTHEK